MDYKVTPEQIKMIHTLLRDEIKQDKDLKASLIVQFTEDENKTSTKDLTFVQANDLIYFLQTGKVPTNEAWATFDAKVRQHRYILSLCHQLDWVQKENPKYVDLNHLGAWLKKYGYLHKPLKAYKYLQLPKLIRQLEYTRDAYLEKKQEKQSA